jgi:ribosomal protein S24E
MKEWQSLAQAKWGVQVSCGNRPKAPQEGAVREIEKKDRGNSSGAVPVQRHKNSGGAYDGRSYTHVYMSAAEIQHSDGDRVSERQKRNQDTQRTVRTRAQRVYE